MAGIGTRVMPLSLHLSKGMIGIVDKPVVHYIIDELVRSGIKEIVLVANPGQPQFKKYLDYLLKKDLAWSKIKFRTVFQKIPKGNADAVMAAKKFLKNDPFVVSFCDDIVTANSSPIKKLIDLFYKTNYPVIMLKKIPRQMVSNFGIVKTKKVSRDFYQILDLVEKPRTTDAPSNLGIVGHYVLTPKVLTEIGNVKPSKNKELYLTDALVNYIRNGGKMYGWLYKGRHFDCGSKIGILKAQTYFGLRHPDFKKEYKQFLFGIKATSAR